MPTCLYCHDEPLPDGRACPRCEPDAPTPATDAPAVGQFCGNCGTARGLGAFCSGCGTRLDDPPTAAAPPGTDHAPAAARAPLPPLPVATRGGPPSQYGWVLAGVPLVLLGVYAVVTLAGYTEDWVVLLVTGLALALNVTGALLDTRTLREAGYEHPSIGAALLIPIYLVLRAIRYPTSWLIVIAWVVTTVVYFAGWGLVAQHAPLTFYGAYLEELAEDSLAENDIPGDVTCEATIQKSVGETFSCPVTGSVATLVAFVVEDAEGRVRWSFS